MNTTLGKRIAAFRREKEWKQDELAEKLGVSAQAVSKWENDQCCPDISLLPQLSKLLGVSVDELLTGKKEELPAARVLPENERKSPQDMLLRIELISSDGDAIRVNLPLALVETALECGLSMSQILDNQALTNIDPNKIMEMVKLGAVGNLVEMESSDGDTIRIFVE